MKDFYQNLRSALVVMLVGLAALAQAQNVTIRPKNGTLLPNKSTSSGGQSSKVGFNSGLFSLWHHNQLELTLTTSDAAELTDDGLLKTHNNNMTCRGDSSYLTIVDKYTDGVFISLALPNGYRITGYNFVFTYHDASSVCCTSYSMTVGKYDYVFCEMDGSFSEVKNTSTLATSDTQAQLQRTSLSEDDMGNNLYFKLYTEDGSFSDSGTELVAIDLLYAEVTFTANEGYDVNVAPATTFSEGVSYVEVPFATGKMDVGVIQQQSDRQSYTYSNVEDLSANMLFYEQASVDESLDMDARTVGTATGNKTIYGYTGTDGYNYFKVASGNTYFVETPVEATIRSASEEGTAIPMHYRITGATFHFSSAYNTTVETTGTVTKIYVASGGGGGGKSSSYYYLNCSSEGTLSYSTTDGTNWNIDDSGHIYCTVSGTTYYIVGTTSSIGTTNDVNGATAFTAYGTSSTTYYYITSGYSKYYIGYSGGGGGGGHGGGSSTSYTPAMSTNKAAYVSTTTSTTTEEIAGTLPAYTATVYGKDGTTVAQTVSVDENGTETVTLEGLNNDAVKFEVSGEALVRVDLTIESLNPYINEMSVVCLDVEGTGQGLSITQKFTSDDFEVGGGDFYFNLPDICEGDAVEIHFGDLYSTYGDDTYYTGTQKQTDKNARYGYVGSDYFNLFDGTTNNIYNNVAEAADHDYKDKVYVTTVGDKYYKFNNASECNVNGGYLTEYFFTIEKYKEDGGNLKTVYFPYVHEYFVDDTAYVFTTDETRYNIAPTTGTQHRYYAYYQIGLHVNAESGTPEVTLTKIYNEGETLNTDVESPAYYGARVEVNSDTRHACFSDNGTIWKAIKAAAGDIDLSQLLYLDFSQMVGVLEMDFSNVDESSIDASDLEDDEKEKAKAELAENKQNYIPLSEMRKELSPNAIIFMPWKQTYEDDNFVTLTDETTGTFAANKNIVLTDQSAFYNPYDFTMGSGYYGKYTRGITAKNGTVTNATLMIPFSVNVTEGKHTNADGSTITFYQMQSENCISDGELEDGYEYNIGDYLGGNEGEDFLEYVHFEEIEDANTTPNMAYFVQVDGYSDSSSSFAIAQPGATFYNTTAHLQQPQLEGNTSTGTYTETSEDGESTTTSDITFKQYGTYSGYMLPKADNDIYYFQKNKFVNSANLSSAYNYVYLLPFRTWYLASGDGSSAKNLLNLGVILAPNNSGEGATRITQTAASQPDLAVMPGTGTLTLAATTAQRVDIYTVAGQRAAKVTLAANSQKTIALPAGIYVVNGQKMLVK